MLDELDEASQSAYKDLQMTQQFAIVNGFATLAKMSNHQLQVFCAECMVRQFAMLNASKAQFAKDAGFDSWLGLEQL